MTAEKNPAHIHCADADGWANLLGVETTENCREKRSVGWVQMSLLCAPTGSEGVRAYRFYNAPLGATMYEGDVGRDLVKWLEKNGMEWDGFWTNAYTKPSQAVTDLMRDFDIPVIIDVDDYFDEIPTGNVAHSAWFHRKKVEYNHQLANADRRVTTTPWLAEHYNCQIAPNFVNPDGWLKWGARPRNDDSCVLLHCGSVNRAEDYLTQEQAFRAFLDLPNTKIIFMGWMPKWADDYPVGKVVFCRWVEYEKYQRMMRWLAPDLLVSPMVHNKFNLAKSNIKWLEAAMCHACFVGERWGEYERTVEDGVTGVLADGHEEWAEKLRNLALDTDSRREIAKKGYDEVVSMWTWEAVGPLWKAAVGGEEVANGSGSEWIAGGVHGERGAAATS